MKRINIFALLLCAALIALFVLAPALVETELTTDFAREWLEPKREEWLGVLRVWHIGLWQTGKGSGSHFLAARGKEFERKYRGVFIEVESMTPDGALERFARGEAPDVVSFPCGWGQAATLSALKDTARMEGVYGHLLESGRSGEAQLALPYMLSCYMLMYDEDLFSDADIEPPMEAEAANFTQLCAMLTYSKKQGRKTLSVVGLEVPEATGNLPASALLVQRLVPGANSHVAGSAAFKGRAAGMAVGGVRDLAEPERYTFSAKLEPLTRFTDMVQYAGVWKSIRKEAKPYAEAFVYSLLEEGAQKKLESLYAFPVRELESLYDADPQLKEMAAETARAGVPRAFSYARRLEELAPLSKAAMDGDPKALDAFLQRLERACVWPEIEEELSD